jgi:hypothetical protein
LLTPAQEPPAPGAAPGAPGTEAKGMPPRAAAVDYQAQGHAGAVTIGAEFLGHAVPGTEKPYTTEDYVVVEAGAFGPAGTRVALSAFDFTLKILSKNGKRVTLQDVPFGAVLRTLKDPDWEFEAAAEAKKKRDAAANSVSTGSKQSGGDSDMPPPKLPFPRLRAMQQDVKKEALPEGERALPQAGLLFFEFRGKEENIREVELVYTGPTGTATLKLQ